jgi:DNA-binding response OmpR family regulator
VLDVLMPHIDGLEVCRRLRAAGDRTPVLMLSAPDAVDDRVAGLDAGADDYLVKPFALKELQARVRALLRRAESADGEGQRARAGRGAERAGRGLIELARGDEPVAEVEDMRLDAVAAEAHGGRASAADAEGGGAVFELVLPGAREPASVT